jgi:4,5:9,10-diseco-3-hydroxy-5,9,17-trioxoandrosta-1(10),2-diene-4-oate hydrolase
MTQPKRFLLGAAGDREVVVDGVRIAYEDRGAGPAVVCLHAIGHGARDWSALRLPGRRVIAVDWPGQGRSGDDHQPASPWRYAALLRGFIDALGIERAVLVGNSIGGYAALRLASEAPERVGGLVLANTGGLDRRDRFGVLLTRLFARFFKAGLRGARWWLRAYKLYYDMVLPMPAAAEQRRRIVEAGYESAPVLTQAWQCFALPEHDLRDRIPSIKCPVLFTWAKRDRLIQLRRNRPAIERFADAELIELDAGHSPQLEQPERFEAAVREFLHRIDPEQVKLAS